MSTIGMLPTSASTWVQHDGLSSSSGGQQCIVVALHHSSLPSLPSPNRPLRSSLQRPQTSRGPWWRMPRHTLAHLQTRSMESTREGAVVANGVSVRSMILAYDHDSSSHLCSRPLSWSQTPPGQQCPRSSDAGPRRRPCSIASASATEEICKTTPSPTHVCFFSRKSTPIVFL